MKKKKNRLDEMQEQKLLKIEHNGFWIAFWGLFITFFGQMVYYGPGNFKYITGEWIVFMCLSFYMVGACVKNGIWDRKLSPTPVVNLIGSVIGGLFCGVLQFVVSYRKYGKLIGSVAAGIFMFIFTFVACCIVLFISTKIYKKRVDTLENTESEEEESEDESK